MTARPIPEIRAEMLALADELSSEYTLNESRKRGIADELRELAEATRRRPRVGRAAASSRELTPKLAAAIRAYVHANPDRSQQEVANRFKVNPGRVSEALHGDV